MARRKADHCRVAKVLIANAVEVMVAEIDRKILGPIIFDPLKLDETARFEVRHPIWSASQRRLQGGFLEVPIFPIVLG